MHEKDRALIQSMQDFQGGISYVSKPNKTSMVEFRISTLKDIINIIMILRCCAAAQLRSCATHFYNYPLITKKSSDYILFKQIALLMLNKEHNNLVYKKYLNL